MDRSELWSPNKALSPVKHRRARDNDDDVPATSRTSSSARDLGWSSSKRGFARDFTDEIRNGNQRLQVSEPWLASSRSTEAPRRRLDLNPREDVFATKNETEDDETQSNIRSRTSLVTSTSRRPERHGNDSAGYRRESEGTRQVASRASMEDDSTNKASGPLMKASTSINRREAGPSASAQSRVSRGDSSSLRRRLEAALADVDDSLFEQSQLTSRGKKDVQGSSRSSMGSSRVALGGAWGNDEYMEADEEDLHQAVRATGKRRGITGQGSPQRRMVAPRRQLTGETEDFTAGPSRMVRAEDPLASKRYSKLSESDLGSRRDHQVFEETEEEIVVVRRPSQGRTSETSLERARSTSSARSKEVVGYPTIAASDLKTTGSTRPSRPSDYTASSSLLTDSSPSRRAVAEPGVSSTTSRGTKPLHISPSRPSQIRSSVGPPNSTVSRPLEETWWTQSSPEERKSHRRIISSPSVSSERRRVGSESSPNRNRPRTADRRLDFSARGDDSAAEVELGDGFRRGVSSLSYQRSTASSNHQSGRRGVEMSGAFSEDQRLYHSDEVAHEVADGRFDGDVDVEEAEVAKQKDSVDAPSVSLPSAAVVVVHPGSQFARDMEGQMKEKEPNRTDVRSIDGNERDVQHLNDGPHDEGNDDDGIDRFRSADGQHDEERQEAFGNQTSESTPERRRKATASTPETLEMHQDDAQHNNGTSSHGPVTPASPLAKEQPTHPVFLESTDHHHQQQRSDQDDEDWLRVAELLEISGYDGSDFRRRADGSIISTTFSPAMDVERSLQAILKDFNRQKKLIERSVQATKREDEVRKEYDKQLAARDDQISQLRSRLNAAEVELESQKQASKKSVVGSKPSDASLDKKSRQWESRAKRTEEELTRVKDRLEMELELAAETRRKSREEFERLLGRQAQSGGQDVRIIQILEGFVQEQLRGLKQQVAPALSLVHSAAGDHHHQLRDVPMTERSKDEVYSFAKRVCELVLAHSSPTDGGIQGQEEGEEDFVDAMEGGWFPTRVVARVVPQISRWIAQAEEADRLKFWREQVLEELDAESEDSALRTLRKKRSSSLTTNPRNSGSATSTLEFPSTSYVSAGRYSPPPPSHHSSSFITTNHHRNSGSEFKPSLVSTGSVFPSISYVSSGDQSPPPPPPPPPLSMTEDVSSPLPPPPPQFGSVEVDENDDHRHPATETLDSYPPPELERM